MIVKARVCALAFFYLYHSINIHSINTLCIKEMMSMSKRSNNEIIEYYDCGYAEIILYNKHGEEAGRTLVDLDDLDKVRGYRWNITNRGYAQSSRGIALHRLVMDCPDGMVVDHINHDRLDNRKENLRICSIRQNTMNQGISKNNTSGVTGVSLDKKSNKWIAYIKVNYRQITLGRFSNIDDAIQARMDAEIEYFGEYRNDK